MENWQAILTVVGTLLGGGGIFSYFISRRNAKRDDFSIASEQWREDNSRLRDEIEKVRKELDEERDRRQSLMTEMRDRQDEREKTMRLEVSRLNEALLTEKARSIDLRAHLLTIETAHYDLPFPQWIKRFDPITKVFIMRSLNPEYVRVFLEPQGKGATDYIGFTDSMVWGEEIGQEYQNNDMMVMRHGSHMRFVETVHFSNKSGDKNLTNDFVMVKYPVYDNTRIIGIAGVAIPRDYYDVFIDS